MELVFPRGECVNLESALRREWLETNGLGGYASSSIVDCHTRKYHGLLVAALPQHNDKFVLLSKVEAVVKSATQTFHLSTNHYPSSVFHPTGHKYIHQFSCGAFPSTIYRMGETTLVKSFMLVHDENTVLISFTLSGPEPVTLQLSPLLAYRSFHTLTRQNMDLRVRTFVHDGVYKIDPYNNMPPIYFNTSAESYFFAGPYWVNNVEYYKERERGFDYSEDLFCPGMIEATLTPKEPFILRASLNATGEDPKVKWQQEIEYRDHSRKSLGKVAPGLLVLAEKGGQFFIRNPQSKTSVVAGYPWFCEWGRDAMIALPGLAFAVGREQQGLEVLKTFLSYEKNGLIPNYLSIDGCGAAYNAVDASLWFFWAVDEWRRLHTVKPKNLDWLFEGLKRILEAILNNSSGVVNLQENGLLSAGDERTQLTWMDAQVGGVPVTPRHGLAVEINALWFNAVRLYMELTRDWNLEPIAGLEIVADKIKQSFVQTFWSDSYCYLADVVNENGADFSVRPNQIFAVSLTYSPLSSSQQKAVVDKVYRELAVPYGLRTLSPGDARYSSTYHGSPSQRDSAYHQGTVWPWLACHFAEAFIKVSDDKLKAKSVMDDLFEPLFSEHLWQVYAGGVSEVFDAAPPYNPEGCIHQAWSVGEAIRLWRLLYGDGKLPPPGKEAVCAS